MRIKKIKDGCIEFGNNSIIRFDHHSYYNEINFADFNSVDQKALNFDFYPDLDFEAVDGEGFRFGDDKMMFFIPCYSVQDGSRSREISIYFNDKKVLTFDAKLKKAKLARFF